MGYKPPLKPPEIDPNAYYGVSVFFCSPTDPTYRRYWYHDCILGWQLESYPIDYCGEGPGGNWLFHIDSGPYVDFNTCWDNS